MRGSWSRSLFGQLLMSQLGLLAILVIALPALILVTLNRTAEDYVEGLLRHDADLLVDTMYGTGSGNPVLVRPDLGPFYVKPWGSRAYLILDARLHILARGGITTAMPPTPSSLPAVDGQYKAIGNLDIYQQTVVGREQTWVVVVAQDRTRPEVIVDDVVAAFLRRTLWVVPLLLVASAFAGLIVLRRLTHQLREVSAQADGIRLPSLDTRFEVEKLPLEVRGLAAAANNAFDRVVAGYRRESQFVSSVAHELRTPMALLTLACDALPDSAQREGLRKAIDQVSHVISQLMELAMIEGRTPVMEPVILRDVAQDVVAASAPMIYRSGRSIAVVVSGAEDREVTANGGLLRIAVTNLIDNAVRHTPPGTRITVRAEADRIIVSDNGPGMQRDEDGGDVRYRSMGLGRSDSAGLGFSIVQRIMAAIGGTMEITSDRPGAHISLQVMQTGGSGRS